MTTPAIADNPQSELRIPQFSVLPRRCDHCRAPYRGNGITIKTPRGPREFCCLPCLEEFIAVGNPRRAVHAEHSAIRNPQSAKGDCHVR
jgi:hypothetical protein